MSSTPFKGSLKAKRKGELTEIAQALGIGLDQSQKKEELEDLIREHLLSHKNQYSSDDNFRGLIDSLDSGRRRSARSSSVNGNADSDASDSPESSVRSPRKHSQRPSNLGTPSTPFGASASELATTVKQRGLKARKSLDKLVDSIQDSARSTAHELTSEVQDAQSEVAASLQAVQGEAAKRYRKAKNAGNKLFVRTRTWLSDAHNLVRLLIAFEGILLVLATLPTTYVQLGSRGPHIPVVNPKSGINGYLPHWAITLPDPRALVSVAFYRPLVLWAVYSVLVPLAVAHLVTFDRRSQPSTYSFLLARLSALVFLARVLPNSTLTAIGLPAPAVLGVAAGEVPESALIRGLRSLFSYDYVLAHLGVDLQIWATATAFGFAQYEAIAIRPRAA
ncbi:cl- channel CLC-3 and related proteins [Moesziomyces antarcticus T-34]|uniref:Cl-channel CLC-3 and related proteins n=1 Tax=Pseudozyma antarctica (strain T-34) TaxID=1151754 RepID=M9LU26_PSEA3|nr:cl- channel CLC-3 and related proteins [Moesziomyces antarcticus T-34]